jgi:uncharacterized protein YjbI with pentapeptide repeats
MHDDEKEDADELTPENLDAMLKTMHLLREKHPDLTLDLTGKSLKGFNLEGKDLRALLLVNSDLTKANMRESILCGVDLTRAILSETDLHGADLTGSRLVGAHLYGTNFFRAKLKDCDLTYALAVGAGFADADLSEASLRATMFTVVNMNSASLVSTDLLFSSFSGVEFRGANFERATFSHTVLAGCDMRDAVGLAKVEHDGPSSIDSETLRESGGALPEAFLRGCGLSDWEILTTRLYTPLTAEETKKLCGQLLESRLKGSAVRLFISYSHSDEKFALKLCKNLRTEGFMVWLDRHELKSGSLHGQVRAALAEQDVVIVILSANSIESDWVENELEIAREREKGERRDLICPIAIDDTWKNMETENRTLWRKLREKYIVDFSGWNTKLFNASLQKLVSGLRANYATDVLST